MKKILLLAIIAITATSCVEYGAKEIGDEYEVNISEIEHEGHYYLLFDGYGVLHNPNCKCTKVEK